MVWSQKPTIAISMLKYQILDNENQTEMEQDKERTKATTTKKKQSVPCPLYPLAADSCVRESTQSAFTGATLTTMTDAITAFIPQQPISLWL
jgi:hypothetical protein